MENLELQVLDLFHFLLLVFMGDKEWAVARVLSIKKKIKLARPKVVASQC